MYFALSGASRTASREWAIAKYRKAIQVQPNYPMSHFFLGQVYLERKQYEQAAASLRTTVRLAPDYANARTMLGETLIA